jgi:hypothetical protein
MTAIPHQVLSEAFEEHIQGRSLKAACFLTFQFDPGFFEQEILPVFLDLPLSQVPAIRTIQMEEALSKEVGPIAVYYDRQGIVSEAGPAKLDIQRVPVAWKSGIFHPKNILALLEDREPDKNDHHPLRLLVATSSANLTESGWWRNVEACHIEVIEEESKCGFRDDLLRLLRRIRQATPLADRHPAMEPIRRFIVGLAQYRGSKSGGVLHPRLYVGQGSVADFLDDIAGRNLLGLNLEIISPYLDRGEEMRPLKELVDRFSPPEVRVLLPRDRDGSALCEAKTHKAIREIPGAVWGELPETLLESGRSKDAPFRRIHAKVYRFFDPRHRYEAVFVGSVNLTRAGHSAGGNFETGILVESELNRVSDWWLKADTRQPNRFEVRPEDGDIEIGIGVSLLMRYRWNEDRAEACWDRDGDAPVLHVSAQGSQLFDLVGLTSRQWTVLDESSTSRLREILQSTSLLTVSADAGGEATILVIEEGMAAKPSILLSLSVTDILRYWSLLTPAQREAVVAQVLAKRGLLPPEYDPTTVTTPRPTSFFDSFAGIFHAFGCLEREVLKAIAEKRETVVDYRLFGQKYDSLPTLIGRVFEEKKENPADAYVILLCAKQLLNRIQQEHPAVAERFRTQVKALNGQFAGIAGIRDGFTFGTEEERQKFFAWFDHRFLARAKLAEVAE